VAKRVLRLLHITDTHLHAAAESRMRGVCTAESFAAVVEHAMADADGPDAILATGDLVQDETRAGYERLHGMLKSSGLPVYCLPGNHDAPDIMAEVLDREPFQVGGEVRAGNWSLLLLDSHSAGDDGGRLKGAELARLRDSLASAQASHYLVCLHHHPLPMGSRWLDGVALRNGDEFLELLDESRRVRGVLWGHVHQASDRQRHGVRLMSTPSTCLQFLPNSDSFAVDSRPPGYRWVDLMANGRIDTEVVWVPDA
jgi:Icc protein